MRIIGILAAISLYLWACSSESSTKEELSGFEIYRERCMTCHGTDGRMGMNGAKELPSSPLSVEQRIDVVANGRNIMPAFKGMMSEAEIKAVVEYTMTLK